MYISCTWEQWKRTQKLFQFKNAIQSGNFWKHNKQNTNEKQCQRWKCILSGMVYKKNRCGLGKPLPIDNNFWLLWRLCIHLLCLNVVQPRHRSTQTCCLCSFLVVSYSIESTCVEKVQQFVLQSTNIWVPTDSWTHNSYAYLISLVLVFMFFFVSCQSLH